MTYSTAHGNSRLLTYWVRPRIKPASSVLLVRFVSTVPQLELREMVVWIQVLKHGRAVGWWGLFAKGIPNPTVQMLWGCEPRSLQLLPKPNALFLAIWMTLWAPDVVSASGWPQCLACCPGHSWDSPLRGWGRCLWIRKINSLEPGNEKVTFWALSWGKGYSFHGNEQWFLRSTLKQPLTLVLLLGSELKHKCYLSRTQAPNEDSWANSVVAAASLYRFMRANC